MSMSKDVFCVWKIMWFLQFWRSLSVHDFDSIQVIIWLRLYYGSNESRTINWCIFGNLSSQRRKISLFHSVSSDHFIFPFSQFFFYSKRVLFRKRKAKCAKTNNIATVTVHFIVAITNRVNSLFRSGKHLIHQRVPTILLSSTMCV